MPMTNSDYKAQPPLPDIVRDVRPHYRTGHDDLADDFFAPCLRHCGFYRRAAGYFSTKVLVSWIEALPRLAHDELDKIQLLISPILSEEDKTALGEAMEPVKRDALRQILADKVVEDALLLAEQPQEIALRLKLFAWMVANNKLEIRFAFPEHISDPGIYHEKIGIFDFAGGAKVAFTGSANETQQGHTGNYESVDVYRSWKEKKRVHDKEEQFDEAWNGQAQGLKVCALSKSVLAKVIARAPSQIPKLPINEEVKMAVQDKNAAWKWRHQDEAVDAWFRNDGHGVLNMATGTGKTRTAFKILSRLLAESSIDRIIITTDGVDLLNQWWDQIFDWQKENNVQWRQFRHYSTHHELERFVNNPKNAVLLLSREQLKHVFHGLKTEQRQSLVIVHDEVHALGSKGNREALSGEHQSCRYRLGLSATPERPYDDEGSDFIANELGPVVFSFELEDAIERGILCEFDYVPLKYKLTESDREQLRKVYSIKAARARAGKPMTQIELWIELSKVYKTAERKPANFAIFLKDHPESIESAIIFVETKEYGEQILEILAKYTHRYRTYYAEDEKSHLESFAKGEIDCLITCHKLSQGIDIPHLKNVILFSSSRGRLETTQRIGRCLRTSSDYPNKRATVVDFVLEDSLGAEDGSADADRSAWLMKLSTRRNEENHAT